MIRGVLIALRVVGFGERFARWMFDAVMSTRRPWK